MESETVHPGEQRVADDSDLETLLSEANIHMVEAIIVLLHDIEKAELKGNYELAKTLERDYLVDFDRRLVLTVRRKLSLAKEHADAHVVRYYMHQIDDANEPGSDRDVNLLIQEMNEKCDPRVIAVVSKDRQLARQALRPGQAQ